MKFWFSTEHMTVFAETDDRTGLVVSASPIITRFIGQPCPRLRDWLEKQPGYRSEVLK